MVREEESELEKLKKDYAVLEKKYKLPSFKELNEDFDIEKSAEHETDFILREIRKLVMDKVVAYLRFVEMLLNPANSPMFFLALIKGLTSQDKRILERIYEKLGDLEIDVIELDAVYNEEDEAEFIKKISKEWKEISKEMVKMVEVLRRNWHQKSSKGESGYCG